MVVGDVHGAYERLVEALSAAAIVDSQSRWSGGSTHLVSLGDVLDRGPGARPAIELLMRLQTEAAAVGGRVHVLLGNHELMNLLGDLRDVPKAEIASFAPTGSESPGDTTSGDASPSPGHEERYRAFAPEGHYGRWLLAQPAVLIINDTAFVHGGLPPAAAKLSPAELDRAVKDRLSELFALRTELEHAALIAPYGDTLANAARLEASPPPGSGLDAKVARFVELAEDPLLGDGGVMWYRGTALCHDLLERPVLDAALDKWQVDRVVVGHTPTADSRVRSRFDGRAVLADTGMLEEVYHGQPAALLIQGDSLQVLYPETGTDTTAPDPHAGLEFDGVDAVAMERILTEGTLRAAPTQPSSPPTSGDSATPAKRNPETTRVEVTLGDRTVTAQFEPGSRSAIDRGLAAYALDRLLGLDLVVPVAAREFEGKRGVVSARWTNTIDEQVRSTGKLSRDNWCAVGSDYQLLYAFDALVRNVGRTPHTMLYDRRTWQLGSAGHATTFGTGRDFPPYLANAPKVVPPALAERLRALDEATLTAALGELLSKAQLRALLARRDELLSTWNIAQAHP